MDSATIEIIIKVVIGLITFAIVIYADGLIALKGEAGFQPEVKRGIKANRVYES